MILGSLNGTSVDTTPRKDGLLGGAAWTSVPHSDPIAWTNLGPFIDCPAAGRTTRVSYEVRGRYLVGDGFILSVGQAWVKNVDGDSVIVEIVETFTNARVEFHVDGSSTVIRVQSHLTEDWEFQVKITYDLSGATN